MINAVKPTLDLSDTLPEKISTMGVEQFHISIITTLIFYNALHGVCCHYSDAYVFQWHKMCFDIYFNIFHVFLFHISHIQEIITHGGQFTSYLFPKLMEEWYRTLEKGVERYKSTLVEPQKLSFSFV